MKHIGLCTSGIIINEKQQILIVKRSDADDFLPGYWVLPGGGLDYGETPDAGIRRELFEESGIHISKAKPFVVTSFVSYENTPREKQYVEVFYLCEYDQVQEVQISFEHSDYRWVKATEVDELYMTDYIKDIIKQLHTESTYIGKAE